MPVVRGADGYELARHLRPILGLGDDPDPHFSVTDYLDEEDDDA
jgi:hypothetical protein